MPKLLLVRCAADSIKEFRAAARERFEDAAVAAAAGRKTAAIYLWGYVAEMTLKAAYFSAFGFDAARPITIGDLRGAAASAPALGVIWPGAPRRTNLHSIRAWAELLISFRAATPGLAYPDPGFATRVVAAGRVLEPVWSEVLRYHKNVAYQHEVERVRKATTWLFVHRDEF